MAIIEARGLARTFTSRKRTVEAVRGVDLTVADGEIVGFLGPNGAGKTTTLRMLTTLLRPTAGTATVAGADLLADPVGVRRRIGYVAQAIGVTGGGSDPNAKVGEEITLQAQLYRVPAAEIADRTARLTRQLDLGGLEDRLVKTLSGGQRRRLDIALGLVHSPRLVFLDEPTTGLDPQSRSNLWDHIRRLREDLGTTVFLTTHYLDEADALSDRIIIIDRGRIVASDTADNLKAQVAGDLVDLELADPAQVADAADRLSLVAEAARPGVTGLEVEGRHVRGRVQRAGRVVPSLLRELERADITLDSIEVIRPTLDDVFLTLTGRSLRDAEASTERTTTEEGEPAPVSVGAQP
jgi:ABC-2 type transport system ATP-binding protein